MNSCQHKLGKLITTLVTLIFLIILISHHLSVPPAVFSSAVFESVHKLSLVSGSVGPLLNTEPLSSLFTVLSSSVAVALPPCSRLRTTSPRCRRRRRSRHSTFAGRQHCNRGVPVLKTTHLNPFQYSSWCSINMSGMMNYLEYLEAKTLAERSQI